MGIPIFDLDFLKAGFKFELEVAGITYWGGKTYLPHERIPREDALREVINSELIMSGDQPAAIKKYNPASPQWGKLGLLFKKVRAHLRKSGDFAPQTLKLLRLYIGIGSKLDFFYGGDLIFTLKDMRVMVDITGKEKDKPFLIQPHDVEEGFETVSRRIANQLIFLHRSAKKQNMIRKGVHRHT